MSAQIKPTTATELVPVNCRKLARAESDLYFAGVMAGWRASVCRSLATRARGT